LGLLDLYSERCRKLIAVVDGAPSVGWAKGAAFSAAILFGARGLLAQEPEEPDRLKCSVTVQGEVPVGYGDLFLREKDGYVYRVLSDPEENMTPPGATLQLRQFRAERYGKGEKLLHEK